MKISKEKLEIAMGNALVTAKELSEQTGIAPETITRIKKGKQNPKPVTIGKIAKALNVKVEDLVE
ncbi:MAG: helix-turn-helix domain-containing protein [Oscillospiraceae bacterium]